MKKIILILTTTCCITIHLFAQNNVGIGTNNPHAESKLEIQSTTGGVLIPRMNSTERIAIADETGANKTANGMMIYDITLNKLMIYDSLANSANGKWQAMVPMDSINAWSLNGNSNTQASTQFIGTIDSVDLVFKNNNNQNMRLFANGSWLIGDSIEGPGSKTFFDITKNAFRSGNISTNSWNKDSLGIYSFAAGFNTRATGNSTIALGNTNIARGNSSIALGSSSIASGDFSTSIGTSNSAIGNNSMALGTFCFANGSNSMAMGLFALANGSNSFVLGNNTANGDFGNAFGQRTTANGTNSTAFGSDAIANGYVSTSMGSFNKANGDISTATGLFNNANGYASFVVGQYNDSIITRQTSVTSNTPLFIVGNGDNSSFRRNALTVFKDGKVGIGTSAPQAKLHYQNGVSPITNFYPPNILIESSSENLINFIGGTNARQGLMFEDFNAPCIGNSFILYNETYNKKGLSFMANRSCFLSSFAIDMVIDSMGRIGINKISPTEILDVNGKTKTTNFQMTNGAGLNKIMTSDTGGTASWIHLDSLASGTLDEAYDFGGKGNGRTITADSGAVKINGEDGLIVTGLFGNGENVEINGSGTRMFFNPRKAAFRAGFVNDVSWNNDSIGNFSFATNNTNKAIGSAASAFGQSTVARGTHSFTSGQESNANNSYSVAMGLQNTANGYGSKAIGHVSIANGDASISLGFQSISNGIASTAMGNNTVANGTYSTTTGSNTRANGSNSFSTGVSTVANGFSSFVVGQFNDTVVTTQTLISTTTPLFIIGNGISSLSRKNAVVVQHDGDFGINNNDPLKKLHILGDGGKSNATASTDAELVLEEAGDDLYMSILTDTNQESGYQFGNQFSGAHGGMYYNSIGNSFDINFRTNGNVNRMTIDKVGNVGIGTSSPLAKLEVNGGLILDDLNSVTITADNQAVTVGNSSYLRLSSDNITANLRTIVLSNGLNTGQILFIECNEAGTDVFEILDGAASNTNLAANRTMTAGDVIQLIWNGSNWLEVNYSNN